LCLLSFQPARTSLIPGLTARRLLCTTRNRAPLQERAGGRSHTMLRNALFDHGLWATNPVCGAMVGFAGLFPTAAATPREEGICLQCATICKASAVIDRPLQAWNPETSRRRRTTTHLHRHACEKMSAVS